MLCDVRRTSPVQRPEAYQGEDALLEWGMLIEPSEDSVTQFEFLRGILQAVFYRVCNDAPPLADGDGDIYPVHGINAGAWVSLRRAVESAKIANEVVIEVECFNAGYSVKKAGLRRVSIVICPVASECHVIPQKCRRAASTTW